MNAFDYGSAADADLLVFADWLEEIGNADSPSIVRRMVEELRALDAEVAKLRDDGRVRPGMISLFVREDPKVCRLGLYRFVALPGHSGRRGRSNGLVMADDEPTEFARAYMRHAPAPACGELANATRKHHWFVVDVLMRRYGFENSSVIDEAGTTEIT